MLICCQWIGRQVGFEIVVVGDGVEVDLMVVVVVIVMLLLKRFRAALCDVAGCENGAVAAAADGIVAMGLLLLVT